MSMNMTTAAAILKKLYPEDVMKDLTYADHPFLEMVPKDEKFVGENLIVPLVIAKTPGRSATFSDAQGNVGAIKAVKFSLDHNKDYAVVQIDSLTIRATEGKKGAFASALKLEIDGGVSALSKSVSDSLFGDGSGAIGNLTGSAAGATDILLADINEIVHFDVGMSVEFRIASTGVIVDAVRVISAVNRTTGTFTIPTITLTAVDHDIYAEGDYDANGLKIHGLAAWIPVTAPSASDFTGLDRSVDPTRLAGLRSATAGAAGQVDEILAALAVMGREGANPDVILCSFSQFANIATILDGAVRYKDVKKVNTGFQYLELTGPKGTIKVVPDASCPRNIAWILSLKSWKLWSAGPVVGINDFNGKLLTVSDADAFECRVVSYAELSCNAPGHNMVLTLNAA